MVGTMSVTETETETETCGLLTDDVAHDLARVTNAYDLKDWLEQVGAT